MAQSFNTNLGNVAVNYMQLLKLPVTKTTLQNNLEENPYYPSLYSLSTVFSRFKIDNQAFEIDDENLQQFEPPFIAYLNIPVNGKDFVLVTKITNTTVNYIADGSKTKTISKENFLKGFQKVVFVAEGNAQSGEKGYAENLLKEKKQQNKNAALIGGGVLLLLLIIVQFFNALTVGATVPALLTLTKLSGLTITILLLVYEVDKTNSFVKNICTAGKQTNCDAVLNSKAGKILGMSWSEAGFFYFAATTLFLLLPGIAFTNKLPWLAIAASAAVPYILFSVYYQWKVVKQWCPLCLAVQAVLAIEFVWALFNFWVTNNYATQSSQQSSPFPPPWGDRGGCFLYSTPHSFVVHPKTHPSCSQSRSRLQCCIQTPAL